MLHSADIFVKLVLCPAFSSLFQYCFLEPQMLFLFCKQRRCCGRMMGHTDTSRLSDRQTDARRFINPAPHTVDSAKNARYVLPPSQEKIVDYAPVIKHFPHKVFHVSFAGDGSWRAKLTEVYCNEI